MSCQYLVVAHVVSACLVALMTGVVTNPITLLRNVVPRLKPDGRVGIGEYRLEGGGPKPPLDERVGPETVIRDAETAGLRLITSHDSFRYQYFLIFVKNIDPPGQ